jgi:hypothetical protein
MICATLRSDKVIAPLTDSDHIFERGISRLKKAARDERILSDPTISRWAEHSRSRIGSFSPDHSKDSIFGAKILRRGCTSKACFLSGEVEIKPWNLLPSE